MKTQGAFFGLVALVAGLAAANTAWSEDVLNQDLPLYRPTDQMTGEVTLTGSGTMAQLAAGWIDSFRQFHPGVTFKVDIKGSRSALSSMIDGTATFGMLSRTISKEEVEAFEQKFGYSPKLLIPSYERLAIYVNKDNPISELTLAQVQSMFAKNGKARTWGDVGATGAWASRPIALQGRGPTTGSTEYFQTAILRGDSFDDKMVEHASNSELIAALTNNPDAVGYAGLMFHTSSLKAVPLSPRAGLPAITVDGLEADQGRYPLMRPLQIVVNQAPGKELRPVEREFLKYIFSRMGQEDVIKGGFQPIPGSNARYALGQVGLREFN
ncbi:MAG: PstS family phosphate ABC transporter substrate-binding protein [Planctomycetaceae bacterium]|nr:PstS family phosphate ABC transporter substrate-binding protein [Planctomycetaceae bacterium]